MMLSIPQTVSAPNAIRLCLSPHLSFFLSTVRRGLARSVRVLGLLQPLTPSLLPLMKAFRWRRGHWLRFPANTRGARLKNPWKSWENAMALLLILR